MACSRLVRLAVVVSFLGGCRWLLDKDADTPPDATSGLISVAAGGVVRTPAGITLEVPPGAVSRDVEVTIASLQAAALDPGWGAGVRLEPSGLRFSKPATLTIPLSRAAAPDRLPGHLEFLGSDPASAYQNGLAASLSADRRSVTIKISHFSGAICAANCHAGTREFLTKAFAARGLDARQMQECIGRKFPGATLPEACDWLDPPEVQLILDTFFDQIDFNEYTAGVDVGPGVVERLAMMAASGRNVVFAFSEGGLQRRSGPRNLYPDIDHTATVELRDGQWQIRNTAKVGSAVLRALGGTNLAWWPLDDLNGFRKLLQGVGVEVQACGKPGCLARDYEGDESNPSDRIYAPLEERKVPWSAVRIYVEKTDAIAACRTDAGAPPPPDATPDTGKGPDAGVDAPLGPSPDLAPDRAPDLPPDLPADRAPDALTCPVYMPTVGFCAGENNCPAGGAACSCGGQFCCSPGFCWTRYIAGCTQETCPPGAGRNYTNHCTCPPNTRPSYDPCRPGLVRSCDPV